MRGAAGFGTVGADGSGFGIPGGAEENDDGRQVHPDEKTDDRGQTAVHDAVGYTLDVKSEKNIGEPPQERGDDGARDDVAKTGFLRTRDTIDHDQGGEEKEKRPPQEKTGSTIRGKGGIGRANRRSNAARDDRTRRGLQRSE